LSFDPSIAKKNEQNSFFILFMLLSDGSAAERGGPKIFEKTLLERRRKNETGFYRVFPINENRIVFYLLRPFCRLDKGIGSGRGDSAHVVCVLGHLDVALISPGSAPRVLDQPVFLASLLIVTIADEKNLILKI